MSKRVYIIASSINVVLLIIFLTIFGVYTNKITHIKLTPFNCTLTRHVNFCTLDNGHINMDTTCNHHSPLPCYQVNDHLYTDQYTAQCHSFSTLSGCSVINMSMFLAILCIIFLIPILALWYSHKESDLKYNILNEV